MSDQTTNTDLLLKINALEAKVDKITTTMEQAMGAWFFVKLMASVAIGFAIVWNVVKEYFK